ncbi:MAG: hypothetical protein IJM78_05365 [Prevotella sp.]|nr:hypothetical protein [Prevotella sp.]
MKKIFTLIAVAAMALSASAQEISFTEADVVAASTSAPLNNKTFSNGSFSITVTDGEGKFAIDANNAYFGDATAQTKYSYRLKTGGKSQTTSGKARFITLNAPSAGTVKVCARSASSSSVRAIEVNGTSQSLNDANAISVEMEGNISETNPTGATKVYPVYEFSVAAGANTINFADGAINIYSLVFVAGEGGGESGGGESGGGSSTTGEAGDIFFTEADVVAASTSAPLNNKSFSNGGLTIKITDGEGKFAVDANNAYFGDAAAQTKYSYRLKTGGKSQTTSGKARFITLTVGGAGKVRVCARSASSSSVRAIEVNGTSQSLNDANAISVDMPGNVSETNPTGATKVYPIYEFTVAAGDNTINFADGAVNIYDITYIPDSPTAISSVTTTATAAAVKKYVENGKVVIVKDGKKFNIAGAQLK